LPEALCRIEQAKEKIQELEGLLPHSPNPNFRERFAAQLESLPDLPETTSQDSLEFRQKASALLTLYENLFGVNDVIQTPQVDSSHLDST
jgi:hypothetical protein